MNAAPSELEALAASARLLGLFLVRELDRSTLDELRAPELAQALDELDIRLPEPSDEALDELAAEYWNHFLNPAAGGPPIQSLWVHGVYESDCASAIRRLAESAALERDGRAARGAPGDHLGSILWLWAETTSRAPAIADRMVRDHLDWGPRALARVAAAGGFYAGVARATCALIDELVARARQP